MRMSLTHPSLLSTGFLMRLNIHTKLDKSMREKARESERGMGPRELNESGVKEGTIQLLLPETFKFYR